MVSRSLCKLALQFWMFYIANLILPSAGHVHGMQNTTASALRKSKMSIHERELNNQFLLPDFHS